MGRARPRADSPREFAEWNPALGQWQPARGLTIVTFRPDGQVSESEYHNPDGLVARHVRIHGEGGRLTAEQWWTDGVLTSRTLHTYDVDGRLTSSRAVAADGTQRENERCHYDHSGRKTKVVILPTPESCSAGSCGIHFGIEGTDTAYSAPGATTSTTTYDERGLPSEVIFHDANNAPVCRVLFTRDRAGRLLTERMAFDRPATFFAPPGGADVPADGFVNGASGGGIRGSHVVAGHLFVCREGPPDRDRPSHGPARGRARDRAVTIPTTRSSRSGWICAATCASTMEQ